VWALQFYGPLNDPVGLILQRRAKLLAKQGHGGGAPHRAALDDRKVRQAHATIQRRMGADTTGELAG
jgi:hypothetical protein